MPRSFDAWLKIQRASADLTQDELAAQLGVTTSTLRRWEDGSGLPRHRAMVEAAVRNITRDAAIQTLPRTDGQRITVLVECLSSVRRAIYHGQRSSPVNGTDDALYEIDLFVGQGNRAARCVLLLDRGRFPTGLPTTVRPAARAFRQAWASRSLAELRHAIEHREEVVWNEAHRLRGPATHRRTVLGQEIPRFSDGFVANPGRGPTHIKYLGRQYGVAGAWSPLINLEAELAALLLDPDGSLRARIL